MWVKTGQIGLALGIAALEFAEIPWGKEHPQIRFILQSQLIQNIFKVCPDRFNRKTQPGCDLGVCIFETGQRGYLLLARRQPDPELITLICNWIIW